MGSETLPGADPRVAGILLAAGSAVRMGRPKQLIEIAGKPMLQHIVDVLEASVLDPIVVVTGSDADRIEETISLRRSVYARNPDHESGNMSSLDIGIGAVITEAEAVVVVPGDQPGIGRDTLDGMARLWREERPWAAVTAYRDRIGHPFVLSASAAAELRHKRGPKLLWRLLVEAGDERVATLEVDAAAPLDINTPDDLSAFEGD